MKTAFQRYEKVNPKRTLGSLIQAQRKQVGLTQRQLAQAADVPRYWLGRWERNRSLPDQADWTKLGAILQLPVNFEADFG